MNNTNQALSKGILIFTGYGSENHPGEYSDRLTAVFGNRESERLLKEIGEILDDMNRLSPDWSSLSLSEAGAMAKENIQERHPDLSEEALKALEWTFTWWWK